MKLTEKLSENVLKLSVLVTKSIQQKSTKKKKIARALNVALHILNAIINVSKRKIAFYFSRDISRTRVLSVFCRINFHERAVRKNTKLSRKITSLSVASQVNSRKTLSDELPLFTFPLEKHAIKRRIERIVRSLHVSMAIFLPSAQKPLKCATQKKITR